MFVSDSTLEKAVFRILRQHELEAHATLPFRELQGLWAYTGLRQGDLRDALRIMFDRKFIDFENSGDGLQVVVTPEGYEHAREHELHVGSLLRDARDKVTLHQAAKRLKSPPHNQGRHELQRTQDNIEVSPGA